MFLNLVHLSFTVLKPRFINLVYGLADQVWNKEIFHSVLNIYILHLDRFKTHTCYTYESEKKRRCPTKHESCDTTLKGVFAKNERGDRLAAKNKLFWSLLILLLSVASIRRNLLKTTHTEERSVHTNSESCNILFWS